MRSQSDTLEEALKDPFSDSVDFLDNDSNGAQYQDFSRSETFDSGTTAGSAIGSQPCVYVGLRNQGATCYLNSLLQVLFHLGKFRSAVYMMSTLETQESIGRALQTVFYQMQFLSGNDAGECATTTALTQAFGWTDRDVHVQHDIQELATKLRDTLTEDMKGTEPAKIINGLFEGIQEHVVDCCDGSYTSRRRQAFYDVQLCIKRVQNVYESLDLLIQKTRLDGENKYKLEHDDGRPAEYKDALKYTQFISFPPVLMLHLERTIMDMTSPTLDMVKLNDLYEYPETLNLAAYLPSGSDPQLSIYDLYGVIVHQGTVQFGHYLAFIRPGVHHTTVESWNWNPWHEFNDSCVRIASSTSALNDLFGGNDFKPTAYMLIYVRRSCVAELFPQSSHIPARRISRHDSPPDYIRQEVENNLVQDRIRKDHQAQKVHQIHIRVMNDDYIRREVYLNQWDILTSPFMESSETQKENASFKYSDKRRQIIDEVEEAATVLYVVLEKTCVFSALVEHVLKHWSGLNSNELRFRPWSFHYPQMKLSYRLAEVITEDRWGGKLCDVLGPYCNWPPPQCCQPGTCDVFLELPRFYMPRYILNVAPDGHATTNVSTAEGYDAANALCHYDEERSFVGTLGNSNQPRRKRRQPEISPHDRRLPTGLEGNRVDAEEEEGDDGDDELDTACIVWSLDLHREYIIERIILQSRQFLPPPEEITIKLGRADGSVVWQHSIRYLPSLLDDVEPLIVDGSYQLKSQNRPQTEHEFDNPSLHCSAQYVEISKAVMRSSNGLSPATLALAEVQVHIDPSQAHSTDVEEMSCFNSAPPLPPASVLLLFVKLYDPIFMRLTYGGLLYVDPSDTLECYESQFRCLLKVGVGVKIRVFDEARYDLVHELNMHCPIRYLNLHTGNIITVQPFYTTTIMDKPPMCPTAVTYYEFLKTMRVVVCIPRPLTSPQKEGLKTTNEELCPECMTLEMCGSDPLGTITRRISDALPGNSKVDPRKIRLYGYDPATDGPAVRSCASTASVTLDVLQNSPWSEFSLRTPCYVWYEILDDAEVEDWEKHGHIIVDIIDDRFCARTQTIELEHYPRGSLVGELLRNETIRRALDTMIRMRQRREGGALSTSTISTPEVEYCLTRVDVESCAIEYIYASTDTVPLDLEERVRLEIHAIPPFHADCDKALQRLVCGCFHSPNGGSAHSFPFLCYIGSAHTLRQLREYLCTQCFAPSLRTEITGIGYGEDCGLGLTIHSFSDTSLLSPNTLMAIEEVGNFSNNSNTPPGAHLPLPHEDTTVIMKVLQPEKDQLVVFRPRPRERYGVYRCIPTSEPELILCKPNTRSS